MKIEFDNVGEISFGLIPVSKDKKWGYANTRGEIVIPLQYDLASDFNKNGLALVKQNGRKFLINIEGNTPIPFENVPYEPSSVDRKDGYIEIIKNDKKGLLRPDGTVFIEPTYYSIYETLSNSLIPINDVGGIGFLNAYGKLIINPQFYEFEKPNKFIPHPYNNLILVRNMDKQWGFINHLGEIVIPIEFYSALPFNKFGLAMVSNADGWGFINQFGKMVTPQYYMVGGFNDNGLSWFAKGRSFETVKYGFMNLQGETVIEAKFKSVSNFSANGLAYFEQNELFGFIDTMGNQVIPAIFDSVSDFKYGIAWVEKDGKYGIIDTVGQYIVEPIFDEIDDFQLGGLAIFRQNKKYGIINRQGKIIVEPIYYRIEKFAENGLARVKKNRSWGFIDIQGNFVIKPQFDNDIEDFNSYGLAKVYGARNRYIDMTGKFIT